MAETNTTSGSSKATRIKLGLVIALTTMLWITACLVVALAIFRVKRKEHERSLDDLSADRPSRVRSWYRQSRNLPGSWSSYWWNDLRAPNGRWVGERFEMTPTPDAMYAGGSSQPIVQDDLNQCHGVRCNTSRPISSHTRTQAIPPGWGSQFETQGNRNRDHWI